MPRNNTTYTFLCSVHYVPYVIKWGRGEFDLSSAFGAVLSIQATLKFQFLVGWKLCKLNFFCSSNRRSCFFSDLEFLSSSPLPFFFYPSIQLQDDLL